MRLRCRRRRLFLNIYHIKLLGCLFDIFHAKASDKGITEDSMDKGNDDDRHHSARTHRVVSIGHSATKLLNSASQIRSVQPERRSEEHTSELQSLMRHSYAVFCLKKKLNTSNKNYKNTK